MLVKEKIDEKTKNLSLNLIGSFGLNKLFNKSVTVANGEKMNVNAKKMMITHQAIMQQQQ